MDSERGPGARPLTFLFLSVFLDLLGVGILVPVLPYIVAAFRSDALTVGLLSLTFAAAQFLASPVLGALSDRVGRRPVLLLSVLVLLLVGQGCCGVPRQPKRQRRPRLTRT